LWLSYLNDELDVSNGPPTVAAYLKAVNEPPLDDEVVQFLELSTNWLQFNTAKAPFDDPRVRLAFAQAIDRQALHEVYEELAGKSLTTLIPQGIPGHSDELGRIQEFDPAKARATLAASGVDTSAFAGVKILTGPAQSSDAVYFAEQFKDHLGIELEVETAGDEVNSRVSRGDYHIRTTFQGHSALYPDPQDFFDVFLSDSRQNETGWKNREYDRLVKQANAAREMTERLPLYDEAHKILVEEAPVAFVSQLNRVFWVKPWVRGIARTPVDTAFLPGDIHSSEIWIPRH
jgi:oligopeptide transport system substrate-binding protein